MSLEGDLSRCAFPADVVLGHDEDGILRRNTLAPRRDLVVLRLNPDATDAIFRHACRAPEHRPELRTIRLEGSDGSARARTW